MARHTKNGEISAFENYFTPKPFDHSDIMTYLGYVKNGKWKEEVEEARSFGKGTKGYDSIKKTLPAVTLSGTFEPERLDANLVNHSGFICMDFDHLPDVDVLKNQIENDEFTFAVFKSISGEGLAAIIKISKPEKHRDYFTLLREYYREKFQVEADSKCINVSRLRGATYDTECFVNTESSTWNKITGLKKISKPKPKVNVIATKTDFDSLINEIGSKGIDITNGYENWLSCGFALAEEFNETGREYFHIISQQNSDYDSKKCDRQFDHCLKSDNGSKITIGTFYYFCKNQGLEVSSKLTKEAVNIVNVKRAANTSREDAKKSIEHLELDEDDIEFIVEEVYSSPINRQFVEDLPIAERVELYITNTYDIRVNELGDFIEIDKQPMSAKKPNQLWIECMKYVDEKVSQSLVRAALDSDKIPSYNPIKEFFESNEDMNPKGCIDKIAESIPSHTTVSGMEPLEYRKTFLKKWLVGMVAGIYGFPNPLVLALCGKKTDTGKTTFFRLLMPEELKRFYDEATLDNSNDRDNVIKLVKNMLIMDDEGASRNYKEAQKFKSLTSKSMIRIRKLHTSIESEYMRIATLGITSNETDIIKEDTNRRIIPIEVSDKMDHDLFNSIDKKEMIMEAYHLYKSGYDHLINRDDIEAFNQGLSSHMEEDQVVNAIIECVQPGIMPVPSAVLLEYISSKFTFIKVSSTLFGKKMNKAKFDRKQVRKDNVRVWCYLIDEASHKKIEKHMDIHLRYEANTNKLSNKIL